MLWLVLNLRKYCFTIPRIVVLYLFVTKTNDFSVQKLDFSELNFCGMGNSISSQFVAINV